MDSFVRNVFIAEVLNGKLETTKMVTVRFSEFEACVATITSKVKEALGQQESFTLTDSQGNEIIDSDGSRVEEKIRPSRGCGRHCEVVEAAQGLKEVSKMIKELSGFAHSTVTTTLSQSEAEVASLRVAFACVVCKGPVDKPMFSTCCRTLIGCKACVAEWKSSHSYCPKCRAVDLENSVHEVAGITEALAPLEKLFLV
ncbi:hypothetical protein UPYG_G00112170 [Umbra pygmaea]|uniref:RING-type domain-containing protein n=1 Tax=Umbra pygmaea TaxID=75934 RepID=A0ABD0X341_UMBPY